MAEVQESLPGTICPELSRVVTYREHQSVQLTEEERLARLQRLKRMVQDDDELDPEDLDESDVEGEEYRLVEVRKLVKQACIGEQCAKWHFGRCGPRTQVHHGTSDYLVYDIGRPPTSYEVKEFSEILKGTGLKAAFTFPVDSYITPGPPVRMKGVTGTINEVNPLDQEK